MTRYSPKGNKVYIGWESVFRNTDAALASSASVGFILNMESVNVSELMPSTERLQKWYVGN